VDDLVSLTNSLSRDQVRWRGKICEMAVMAWLTVRREEDTADAWLDEQSRNLTKYEPDGEMASKGYVGVLSKQLYDTSDLQHYGRPDPRVLEPEMLVTDYGTC
jgi:hypothetical protein